MNEALLTIVGAVAVVGYALAALSLYEQWRAR